MVGNMICFPYNCFFELGQFTTGISHLRCISVALNVTNHHLTLFIADNTKEQLEHKNCI